MFLVSQLIYMSDLIILKPLTTTAEIFLNISIIYKTIYNYIIAIL